MTAVETRPASGGLVLGADVGGSTCRIRVEPRDLAPGGTARDPDAVFPSTSRAEFLRGLERFSTSIDPGPAAAALAFAGPVRPDGSVLVTNWPEPRRITSADLRAAGLQGAAIRLANDLGAGALALGERLRSGRLEPVTSPLGRPSEIASAGNRILVSPGTGLGAAGLVALEDGRFLPVLCEMQHTTAPLESLVDPSIAQALRRIHRRRDLSWEDLTSGRGLESLHRAVLRAGSAGTEAPALSAREIAGRARSSPVGPERRALDLYYVTAGRFCQALALAFDSRGGVLLGGSTTRANADLVPGSGFLAALREHPTHRELLVEMPVHLLLEDLNLEGALLLARSLRPT